MHDILDQAGVGRTAFYAHYQDKHDVLHSAYDRVFGLFEGVLDRPSRCGASCARLFPVAESSRTSVTEGLVRALRRDGLLDDARALLAGHGAWTTGRRLGRWAEVTGGAPAGALAQLPVPLLAQVLAGALVESVRWWRDHAAGRRPPREPSLVLEPVGGTGQRRQNVDTPREPHVAPGAC